MAGHAPWDQQQAATIIADHAGMDGATLPILHALQDRFGYIHEEAVPLIAAALNLSRAEVHGVVSFYHEFRRTPPGRHVLKLCRAEACQSVGGAAVADAARQCLGVDWHGTTADGEVTLEPVFCLGLCASGPAALLDGDPVVRLTPERVADLVAPGVSA
ncbi:formate dehydrogenase subunit gamma [Rhodopila sp.]|uniref:formate dehydrogenase subunit gamma n=1 Tax=Rhodopila sp. TaxID=2480087 RepID=UPI002BF8E2EF|nr:formate dehydrogenase subunit gamma [Rhodopila sp.]HVZ07643.1 formate dehydrogenase subunit gamma [Rhodopila sp.]